VATTGGVLVSGPLQTLLADVVSASPDGPLAAVADLRDGIVRLHLRPGFQYRSFHDTDLLTGAPPITLDDGTLLPGRHDGMAAFAGPDGNVWLIRNHEQNNPAPGQPNPQNAFGPLDPYDAHGLGGTTTSLVTPRGEVIEAWTSLNGTMMNCSGGRMPWGAWISCEETVNGPDTSPDFTTQTNQFLEQPHGFIFEVPAGDISSREPIRSAGRFAHEAAAYSPDEGILYLTEDNFAFPSGFYRYIPPVNPTVAGHLVDGGQLQMLKVVGVNQAHLEAGQANGATYPVEWVDIDEPYPGAPNGDGRFATLTNNDAALNFVGSQGRAQGAAHFSRLEGAAWARGEVYFTATQGGGAAETGPELTAGYGNGRGQVWSYSPRSSTLTCRFQSPGLAGAIIGPEVLDFPDNVAARNDRGTVVLCEDGTGVNFLRGLTRDAVLFDIALNQLLRNNPPHASRFAEEFAGATFSPDGETLFVNIQAAQGISFAVWGPWGRIGV
jgi:hypothetical protein